MIRKEKEKSRVDSDLDNKRMECKPRKCFRCRSEYHLITKCQNTPNENDKQQKQVRFSEIGNRALHKYCNNGKHNNDHNIYAYTAHMSDNDECYSRYFGDSLQLAYWILDSGATCNMAPHVSDFITGLLEDMDKHIEVVDGHHVTEKQRG